MIILMAVSTTLIALMPTTECKALYPKLGPANELQPTRPPITTTTRISPEERRKLSLFPKNPTRYIVTERSKITTEVVDTKKSTILPKTHVLIKSITSLDKSKADLKTQSTRSPLLKLKLQRRYETTTEKATTITPTQKEEIIENIQNPELYDSVEYNSEEVYSSENEQFYENSNESDESDLVAMATDFKEESIAVINTKPSSNAKKNDITNGTSERNSTEIVKDKLNSSKEKKNGEITSKNEAIVSNIKNAKKDPTPKLKRSIIEEDVHAVTVIGYYVTTRPSPLKSDVNYNNINM